ncbi:MULTISPECIES: hypothetical protein [unclassified Nocardiopsis]|nr:MULTISPECIES: hypothetical protein [unclassified Nocardiopsis]MBQ1082549.1 hypothetical protein [Nocardiopsis sp. B62]
MFFEPIQDSRRLSEQAVRLSEQGSAVRRARAQARARLREERAQRLPRTR